jgi:hypothetical protein
VTEEILFELEFIVSGEAARHDADFSITASYVKFSFDI